MASFVSSWLPQWLDANLNTSGENRYWCRCVRVLQGQLGAWQHCFGSLFVLESYEWLLMILHIALAFLLRCSLQDSSFLLFVCVVASVSKFLVDGLLSICCIQRNLPRSVWTACHMIFLQYRKPKPKQRWHHGKAGLAHHPPVVLGTPCILLEYMVCLGPNPHAAWSWRLHRLQGRQFHFSGWKWRLCQLVQLGPCACLALSRWLCVLRQERGANGWCHGERVTWNCKARHRRTNLAIKEPHYCRKLVQVGAPWSIETCQKLSECWSQELACDGWLWRVVPMDSGTCLAKSSGLPQVFPVRNHSVMQGSSSGSSAWHLFMHFFRTNLKLKSKWFQNTLMATAAGTALGVANAWVAFDMPKACVRPELDAVSSLDGCA